jgi:hypothetical protein
VFVQGAPLIRNRRCFSGAAQSGRAAGFRLFPDRGRSD